MQVEGRYEIRSKLNKSLLFIGQSHDIEESIRWHKFHLSKSIHPSPTLQNHCIKYGMDDFIFSVPIIETATLKPEMEMRKKRSAKAG